MRSTEVAVRHVVTFRGPTHRERIRLPLVQPLPENTLDPRYVTCESHRTACDCREAELAENIHEYRTERDDILRVLREELAGHATWAYTSRNDMEPSAACKCTDCRIVHRLGHYSIGGCVIVAQFDPGPTS